MEFKKQSKYIYLTVLFQSWLVILCFPLWSNTDNLSTEQFSKQIAQWMNQGKWVEVEKSVQERLADIYAKKMKNQHVPTDLIDDAIKKAEKKEKNLILRRKQRFEIFNQFIEANDELYNLHISLGFAKLNLKKYAKAIANFREALRYIIIPADKKKEFAHIQYQIAIAHRALQQTKGYQNALEKALAQDPQNAQYQKLLGLSYRFENQRKSIHLLSNYLRSRSLDQKKQDDQEKKTNNVYLVLSGLHEQNRRYLDALKQYNNYLINNTNDGDIAFAAGVIAQEKLGQFQKALNFYRQALENTKQEDYKRRFAIHAKVGEIFSRMGEYEKSNQHFQSTKPYYKKITGEIGSIYDRIKEINDKMQKLKLDILRKNDQKSQSILSSYNQNISAERKRLQKVKHLKYGYNMGKIDWQIAQNLERQGQWQQSIQYYQKALDHGYQPKQAYQKILELKKQNGS